MNGPRRISHDDARSKRRFHEYGILCLKGTAMGCADLVPGVSGGTIALILGIYERLIFSLRSLGRSVFWQPLIRLELGRALAAIDAPFLIAVLLGVLIAIASLARILSWVSTHHPVLIASFFFGLVAASIVVVAHRIASRRAAILVAFTVAAAAAFVLAGLAPAQSPQTSYFIALSGAIAVCALILPGISGAFILLLLGKYEFMLEAVSSFDMPTIAIFAMGALVGLVSFAQLLGWLFRRFHDMTLALLCGLMLGSLRKLWPWKEADELAPEALAANTLPELFEAGRLNPEVPLALLLAILGFGAVLGMSAMARVQSGALRKTN